MDNHQDIIHKYELCTCEQYLEIKKLILDHLIGLSVSAIEPEKLQGALMVLRFVDGWKDEYYAALKARKEEG